MSFIFFHWILKYHCVVSCFCFLVCHSLIFHCHLYKTALLWPCSIVSSLWDSYRSVVADRSARFHGKGKQKCDKSRNGLNTPARKRYLWWHFIEQSKLHRQYCHQQCREGQRGKDMIYHARSWFDTLLLHFYFIWVRYFRKKSFICWAGRCIWLPVFQKLHREFRDFTLHNLKIQLIIIFSIHLPHTQLCLVSPSSENF